ncbi:helix-turn-helix domain-containing protein [Iocasia frigidifontis]|uniref:Glycerol operon regulatory protein n=1 Tax=Iocasia fonsfrigidae TaxID=2682810 RepID=A0A8A7K9E7_9FIRM|nr:helix-turn-helix domain-containing protein [Iocasia fonsfrigidae]
MVLSKNVQSISRAINILEKLIYSDKGLGVTEISNSLALKKSTTHRILSTLVNHGYVAQDENSKYKVGLKFFEVGSVAINKLDLRNDVRPFLKKIRDKTNETVHLGLLDNNHVLYIDKVESLKTVRMFSEIGRKIEPHCTSLGKVLLAYSPDKVVDDIIDNGLIKYTDNTITEPDKLKEHLKEVRINGYAIDDEEQLMGVRCIAGPIFNYEGEVIASFSITGPLIRMSKEKIKELSELIKQYSIIISRSFGYIKNNDESV